MTVLVRTSAHFECTETAKRGDIHMSAGFTLDFCDDYIWIRHPAGYCITPESQQRIWAAIGEARKAYDCPLVLEETPETPECSMSKQDAFKSAMQAASAARDLRMACLYPGYLQQRHPGRILFQPRRGAGMARHRTVRAYQLTGRRECAGTARAFRPCARTGVRRVAGREWRCPPHRNVF